MVRLASGSGVSSAPRVVVARVRVVAVGEVSPPGVAVVAVVAVALSVGVATRAVSDDATTAVAINSKAPGNRSAGEERVAVAVGAWAKA
jgi:hypothetical protein